MAFMDFSPETNITELQHESAEAESRLADAETKKLKELSEVYTGIFNQKNEVIWNLKKRIQAVELRNKELTEKNKNLEQNCYELEKR